MILSVRRKKCRNDTHGDNGYGHHQHQQHPVPPIVFPNSGRSPRSSSLPPENSYADPYKEESNLLSTKVRQEQLKAQALFRKTPEGIARIGHDPKEDALKTERKKQYAQELRAQIEMKRSRSSSPAKAIGRKWSHPSETFRFDNVDTDVVMLPSTSVAAIGQKHESREQRRKEIAQLTARANVEKAITARENSEMMSRPNAMRVREYSVDNTNIHAEERGIHMVGHRPEEERLRKMLEHQVVAHQQAVLHSKEKIDRLGTRSPSPPRHDYPGPQGECSCGPGDAVPPSFVNIGQHPQADARVVKRDSARLSGIHMGADEVDVDNTPPTTQQLR